ncbi:MAG: c-type cytochrome domain-containing protein [Chloroflexota bacterium]
MMEFINRLIYNLTEVHPTHTLMVHFPIALTGAALFFILLALVRRNDTLEQIAFANIALAAVSTVAAGLTGYMDNNSIYDGEAPNSAVKMLLAGVLFLTTSVIAIARWRQPGLFHSSMRFVYVGGYFASFALVAVLGFLGGVILYGFHEAPAASTDEDAGSVVYAQSLETPTVAVAPTETPVPGISFSMEVLPILKSRCTNCHGGDKIEEGLDLTSYAAMMAGSKNGPVVIPGDAENSLMGKALIEREMPKRGPKLSPKDAQLIIDWINEGAHDN